MSNSYKLIISNTLPSLALIPFTFLVLIMSAPKITLNVILFSPLITTKASSNISGCLFITSHMPTYEISQTLFSLSNVHNCYIGEVVLLDQVSLCLHRPLIHIHQNYFLLFQSLSLPLLYTLTRQLRKQANYFENVLHKIS